MLRVLPDKWREVRLEEVCERITVGHVGPMAKEYVAAGVPFLRSQNVQPFRISTEDIRYINDDFNRKLRKSALKPGDVVVVRTGYPGTAAVIPATMASANCADLVVITPSPGLDPWYLTCIFNSVWGKNTVAGNLVGVAQQHFNVGAAKAMKIGLPPLPTQQRIAAILSAYDDLIENNTRRIAILEEMARRLYEEWFVHFRFPGHEEAEFDGELPRGWSSVALGDLLDERRDAVQPDAIDPETPYVGLEHIPRRSITLREWSSASTVQSMKLGFIENDILFGKIRPYFHKVALAPISGVTSSDTIVLRPLSAECLSLALCCTSSDVFVDHATQTSNGTKMPRADWKVLRQYPVTVPNSEMLEQFNAFTLPLLQGLKFLNRKNTNLRAQRDLLLPKLVSGEIDVSGAEVELEAAE